MFPRMTPPRPVLGDFTFVHPLRVRWSELDPQGIVFNPNYFVYFDIAAGEYLRAIGLPYPEGLHAVGADLFTVNAQANFRASAVFDDELQIGVRVEQLGRTSVRFLIAIFRGDALLTDGTLTQVTAKPDRSGSVPLPASFVERILAFERVRPART